MNHQYLDCRIPESVNIAALPEKEAEDVITKIIRSWNLADKSLEDEQAKSPDTKSPADAHLHVGHPHFSVGDRVYLHSSMWNWLKEAYKMWEVPFKERAFEFYQCIGWVVSCDSNCQSTVRFYIRSPDFLHTLGVDFQCPNFICRKAPNSVKFKENDYCVMVDKEEDTANTFVVLERLNASSQQLKIQNLQDESIHVVDQEQKILIPVYNTHKPWNVEQRLSSEPSPSSSTEIPRRMHQLIFGEKGDKLSAQTAVAALAHLNNKRDSYLFTQACTRDEDFANTVIDNKVPLVVAIEMNSPFLINILICCGADHDVRDRRGNTLLHIACQHNSIYTVQTLLQYIPNVINTPNIFADTPFHVACKNKNSQMISRFLEMEMVDKTFRDSNGDTGFHALIRMEEDDDDRQKCLKLFMRSGSWLNATNGENLVPLQAAILWKKEQAVNLFLDNMSSGDRPIGTAEADMSLAQAAAKVGNYNIFDRIASGCNGNFMETSTKKTVMHFAVEAWAGNEPEDYQRCRIVQSLLARNDVVRLNQPDCFDNTSIHLLARVVDMIDRRKPYEESVFEAMVQNKNRGLMALMQASDDNYPLATLCFFSNCGGEFFRVNADQMNPLDLLGRDELKVLMSECSKAGVISWSQMSVPKTNKGPEYRSCFRCKKKMEPNNVVYCLPCHHFFACSDCRQNISRMDRCMVCSSEIEAIRAMFDGKDELLHGDMEEQCTEDGRPVSDVIWELKNQIAALEDSILCEICMEEQCKVVFNCGHTACRNCAAESVLKTCHMCRQPITKRVTIF